MSRYARVVDLSDVLERKEALPLLPVQRPGGVSTANYYALLVDKLCEAQRKLRAGLIIAFTAVSPGEGVTHVVESLAWELAAETEEPILLTNVAGLNHAARAGFLAVDNGAQERVYRIEDPGNRPLPRGRDEGLQEMRLRFGFVLVDCPAMTVAPPVQGMSTVTDHFVLVVRAGKTTYPEVTWAQQTLIAASANLMGLVLNRTTEPIPASAVTSS